MNLIEKVERNMRIETIDKQLVERHKTLSERLDLNNLIENAKTTMEMLDAEYPVTCVDDHEMLELNIDKQLKGLDDILDTMEGAVREMEKELSDWKDAQLKERDYFGKIQFRIQYWYLHDLYSFYRKIKRLMI